MSKPVTAYFWKNGEVVEYCGETGCTAVEEADLTELFCVDMSVRRTTTNKYGMYLSGDGWKHIPYDKFPTINSLLNSRCTCFY